MEEEEKAGEGPLGCTKDTKSQKPGEVRNASARQLSGDAELFT